jgi:hypothetical protein
MQIIYYENISHVESKSTSFVLLKLIKFIQITSLFLLEIGQLLCSSSSCLQTLFSSASIGVIEIKKNRNTQAQPMGLEMAIISVVRLETFSSSFYNHRVRCY